MRTRCKLCKIQLNEQTTNGRGKSIEISWFNPIEALKHHARKKNTWGKNNTGV